MERRLEEEKWAQNEGGNKVLLQTCSRMREKKEIQEGRVLRSGKVISTEWITILLRNGNERDVLSIPVVWKCPALLGRTRCEC